MSAQSSSVGGLPGAAWPEGQRRCRHEINAEGRAEQFEPGNGALPAESSELLAIEVQFHGNSRLARAREAKSLGHLAFRLLNEGLEFG